MFHAPTHINLQEEGNVTLTMPENTRPNSDKNDGTSNQNRSEQEDTAVIALSMPGTLFSQVATEMMLFTDKNTAAMCARWVGDTFHLFATNRVKLFHFSVKTEYKAPDCGCCCILSVDQVAALITSLSKFRSYVTLWFDSDHLYLETPAMRTDLTATNGDRTNPFKYSVLLSTLKGSSEKIEPPLYGNLRAFTNRPRDAFVHVEVARSKESGAPLFWYHYTPGHKVMKAGKEASLKVSAEAVMIGLHPNSISEE